MTRVGRLAPSPTGALHVGNARTFLLAWLSLRRNQGTVLLRIEDIDSPRVKPGSMASVIEDLEWLGLNWDATQVEDAAGSHSEQFIVQTRRLDRYRQMMEQLVVDEAVYFCSCTRSEIAASASAPHETVDHPLEGPIYPEFCRSAQFPMILSEDSKLAVRWKFNSGESTFCDGLRGEQSIRPRTQLGDFVLGRSNGVPSYQLAVVVDDHDFGITEVVRGDDLVYSTFRQLAIYEHFDWVPPMFYHVPLMIGTDGLRLAKRHGDTRLSTLRDQGVAPERLVGYLAWTAGLLPEPTPCTASSLVNSFDWSLVTREPTVFDLKLAKKHFQ